VLYECTTVSMDNEWFWNRHTRNHNFALRAVKGAYRRKPHVKDRATRVLLLEKFYCIGSGLISGIVPQDLTVFSKFIMKFLQLFSDLFHYCKLQPYFHFWFFVKILHFIVVGVILTPWYCLRN